MINFLDFRKPQRYIGNEYNVIKKTHKNRIKVCISYPDLYEIGMSNLGLRIIYGLLNEYDDVVCERVFMPDKDLLSYLKESKIKLPSLETKTKLCDFDVIGFNFNYELNFTNFLHILALGGVALKANERKDIIVLGGGGANPEPIAEFVDVFCLGEFEAVAASFIDVLRKYNGKEERLKALSEIDGFYVPSLYEVSFSGDQYIIKKKYEKAKLPIKKVHVKDLDNSYYPLKWLTPHTQIIHDRVPIEIARGCPNSCTFCQARALFYPYRERKIETIKRMVELIYKNSGYENFSFLSFSASNYSKIEQLIDETFDYFKERRIGISFPSLRVDDIAGRLYQRISQLKKANITLAVEAAGADLRRNIKKNIDISRVFEAAEIVSSLNARHMKLYFMYGFPQETNDDLCAIGDFLTALQKRSRLNLNVSINVFIPKPFSSWEKYPMDTEALIAQKKMTILTNMPRRKSIKLSFSDPKKSILEGIMSRADRDFSKVIHSVFLSGGCFDGYNENFSWDVWERAMKEADIDYSRYINKELKSYPWSHIVCGMIKHQDTITK